MLTVFSLSPLWHPLFPFLPLLPPCELSLVVLNVWYQRVSSLGIHVLLALALVFCLVRAFTLGSPGYFPASAAEGSCLPISFLPFPLSLTFPLASLPLSLLLCICSGVSAPVLKADPNFKPPMHPKTDEEREGIEKAIEHFFAFKELLSDQEQCDQLVGAFEMKSFDEGTTLIEQGSEGLEFFVLLEGECDIQVDGKSVKTCTGDTENCYFGELALLYSKPRAASVTTSSAVKVGVLDSASFKHIATAAQMLQDEEKSGDSVATAKVAVERKKRG